MELPFSTKWKLKYSTITVNEFFRVLKISGKIFSWWYVYHGNCWWYNKGCKVIYSSWRFATANTTLFFCFVFVFSLFSGDLEEVRFPLFSDIEFLASLTDSCIFIFFFQGPFVCLRTICARTRRDHLCPYMKGPSAPVC